MASISSKGLNRQSIPNSSFHSSFNPTFNTNPNRPVSNQNKKCRLSSKNPYCQVFTIPLDCGSQDLPDFIGRSAWTNPWKCCLVENDKNRKIVCAGLRWEIYIHPKIGNSHQQFGLSVFPVNDYCEQEMPENYKLHYTIETKLILPYNNNYPQQSFDKFDHSWEREINEIPNIETEDDSDIHLDSNNDNNDHKDYRVWREILPFTIQDVKNNNCLEEDSYGIAVFHLQIKINVKFIKLPNFHHHYYGISSAILQQNEHVLERISNEFKEKEENYKKTLEKKEQENNDLTTRLRQINETHRTEKQTWSKNLENYEKLIENNKNECKNIRMDYENVLKLLKQKHDDEIKQKVFFVV